MFSAYYHLTRKKTTEGKKEQNNKSKTNSNLVFFAFELSYTLVYCRCSNSIECKYFACDFTTLAKSTNSQMRTNSGRSICTSTKHYSVYVFFSSFLFFLKITPKAQDSVKLLLVYVCIYSHAQRIDAISPFDFDQKKYAYVLSRALLFSMTFPFCTLLSFNECCDHIF